MECQKIQVSVPDGGMRGEIAEFNAEVRRTGVRPLVAEVRPGNPLFGALRGVSVKFLELASGVAAMKAGMRKSQDLADRVSGYEIETASIAATLGLRMSACITALNAIPVLVLSLLPLSQGNAAAINHFGAPVLAGIICTATLFHA